MKLIKAIALALRDDSVLKGAWPEPATEVKQSSNWYIEFDEEVELNEYVSFDHEIENLPNGDFEWDDGETITKEEYLKFLADNPTWYEDMQKARQENVGKIAELNKQIAALIDEMTELAEEAGIEVNIDLGQHGSLDPNSDWDSSRC